MTATKKKAGAKKTTAKKTTVKKKVVAKPAKKKAARSLPRPVKDGKPDKPKTFMDEQKEVDALEAKLGRAAKHIKECHALVKEAASRLASCKMETSTPAATVSDLRRVVELSGGIGANAGAALLVLGR